MDGEKKGRVPINPPTEHVVRDLGRTVAEGVVELVPGGGLVTSALRVAHPPRSERARDKWQKDISERTNEQDVRLDDHQDALFPTETLTGLPALLMVRIARDCPDGLGNMRYNLNELCALFPGEERQVVEDAAFDLKTLGLLKSLNWIGGWSLSMAHGTYEQVDAQVMDWDTKTDAVEIARLMVGGNSGHAPDLIAKAGWTKRRFNPAFRLLLALFPDGQVRRVIQPDYPSLGVVLTPESKAMLRRHIAKSEVSR